MDAMDDWKTITKPKSVAPLLALPSQAENDFVPWDFFSVVRIKSTLPTGLPSSQGVVITLAILFNQIRKHHLSFKKTISNKNIITTQETVNHNTEYRISFRAIFPTRFFHTGPSAQLKGSPI